MARPVGAKTSAKVVSITEYRAAMNAIRQRAAEHSAEDQRVLVAAFIAQGKQRSASLETAALTNEPLSK